VFDTVPDAWVAEYAADTSVALTARLRHPSAWAVNAPTHRAREDNGREDSRREDNGYVYYVCLHSPTRVRLLAGPFVTERSAEDGLARSRAVLEEAGSTACALAAVITRFVSPPVNPGGPELNHALGLNAE
jgi:hypothetical protein